MDELFSVQTISPLQFEDPNSRINSSSETETDIKESSKLNAKLEKYFGLKKSLGVLVGFAEANRDKAFETQTIIPDELADGKLSRPFSISRRIINSIDSESGTFEEIVATSYKMKNEETGGWLSVTMLYPLDESKRSRNTEFDRNVSMQFAEYDPRSGEYEQIYEPCHRNGNGSPNTELPNYIRALPEEYGSNLGELHRRYADTGVNILDKHDLGGSSSFYSVEKILTDTTSASYDFEGKLKELSDLVENSR